MQRQIGMGIGSGHHQYGQFQHFRSKDQAAQHLAPLAPGLCIPLAVMHRQQDDKDHHAGQPQKVVRTVMIPGKSRRDGLLGIKKMLKIHTITS